MDTELLEQLEAYRAYMFVMLRALSADPPDYRDIHQAFEALSIQDALLAQYLAGRIQRAERKDAD